MDRDETADCEAIRQTITGYTIAGDSRNAEAFHPLWAEDAVFEFAGYGPLPGFHRMGAEAIRAGTASWSNVPGKDPSLANTSFVRHNLTTMHVQPTGPETARARTYFLVFTDIGPDHSGMYDDELVKRHGRWVFAHRRITLNWRAEGSLFPALPKS